MITIITGTPGTGKTSLVIAMLRDEVAKGRRIYTKGIPELKLPVLNAGNPTTWQAGTWLKIDSYNVDSEADPDDDDGDLMQVESRWQANGNDQSDQGALIVIDEAQSYFRPRGTGKRVPDCIGAFEVHRHQGLDFWLITQRPNLIDSNIRGLTTRHIHLHRGPFGVARIEWAECQDPSSKTSRTLGNRTRYKPDPTVFDLYKSAAEHTKVKVKLPNVFWMLCFVLVAMSAAVYFAGNRISSKMHFDTLGKPAHAESVPREAVQGEKVTLPALPPTGSGAARQARDPAGGGAASISDFMPIKAAVNDSLGRVVGCFASHKKCACQTGTGADAGYPVDKCLEYLGLDALPVRAGTLAGDAITPRERFWAFREREFHRLHPNKSWAESRHYIAGLARKYVPD